MASPIDWESVINWEVLENPETVETLAKVFGLTESEEA